MALMVEHVLAIDSAYVLIIAMLSIAAMQAWAFLSGAILCGAAQSTCCGAGVVGKCAARSAGSVLKVGALR